MEPSEWGLQAPDMIESETRDLARLGAQTPTSETDAEIAPLVEKIGVTSIAEIEKMIGELQAARDFLQCECERVQHETEHYTTLTRMASDSINIISDTVAGWREASHPIRNDSRSSEFDPTLSPAENDARSAREPDQQEPDPKEAPPELASGEEQSSATIIPNFSAQTLLIPALSDDPAGSKKRQTERRAFTGLLKADGPGGDAK